jgi:hypothetical protein
MALAAVKIFVPAEVLYAADLNALNNNVLNNALSLISPLTGSLDVDGNDLHDVGELEFRDEAANPTASGRLRRNGSQLVWGIEDARTTTTLRPLVVQATTSGSPAAGLGVGQLFRAESGDENPSEFGALDWLATDVGAGTEDTVLDVLLRVGGAALAALWRLQATTAFRAVLTHALTAERTYTFPDVSMTLAGINTAQNFSAAQRWAKGANLTAATTLTLGTDGNYYEVDGSTTITALSAQQAGAIVLLRFNNVLTFTHDAFLRLPSEANITTAPGDVALMVSEGSGGWRCVLYGKANGQAVGFDLTADNTGVGSLSLAAGKVFTPAAVVGTPERHGLYQENVPKAWVNLSGGGTPAIADAFNVTGVADDGTGEFTITFDRDFSTTNYVVIATSDRNRVASVDEASRAVGSVQIEIRADTSTLADPAAYVGVLVFGRHVNPLTPSVADSVTVSESRTVSF